MKNELDALESRHKAAAADLASAETAVIDISEAIDECEKDLLQKQRNLHAFRGDDPKRRQRLLDNPEFADFNPATEETEIHRLLTKLKERQSALTASQAALDEARVAERSAYYALARHKHKAAVIGALKLEAELFQYLRAESLIRADAAAREGKEVGDKLPILARQDFFQFRTDTPESGLCFRIREAVRLSYLSGSEDWLRGVCWREAAA